MTIASKIIADAVQNFQNQFGGIAHSPAIGEFALKESVRLKAEIAEYRALLNDCLEYLEPLQDVRDGEDGSLPNEEMSLCTAIKLALGESPL